MSRRGKDGQLPEHVLYHPDLSSKSITLGEGESLHALKSLRMRKEDPVVVTDGRGRWGRGHVCDLGKKRLDITIDTVEVRERWPRQEIWMGMGVLKSNRMDVVLEKASELGVARFFPLVLHRSVARPVEGGSKEGRWHRIALESLKQCRRSHLMGIESPGSLAELLDQVPDCGTLWVAEPSGVAPTAALAPDPKGPLILVVGPEGGLEEWELELLQEAGTVRISLGGNRLRAETAGITLLAAALSRVGSFDPGYSF